MKIWIETILAKLFPPKLPRLHEWKSPGTEYAEQGSCGKAQPKQYKDAIDRHWAEVDESKKQAQTEEELFDEFATKSGRFNF